MSKQYDAYLKKHVSNVKKAFELLTPKLIKYGVFTAEEAEKMKGNLEKHDNSKFGRDEYEAYDKYFYGSTVEKNNNKSDFEIAWLHHIHTNRHHWQHYIIPCENDDGSNKILEMPLNCIIEMVCDWWSFSLSKNKPTEVLDWYNVNKDKIILHPESKRNLNQVMYLVYEYLFDKKLV